MPADLLAEAKRQQEFYLAAIKAADQVDLTPAPGCALGSPIAPLFRQEHHLPAGAREVMPPNPSIDAHIIGHHVEFSFSFSRWPLPINCRPIGFTVVVYSGQESSTTYINAGAVENVQLHGPTGRVVDDLPWSGRAPYHLIVSPVTTTNMQNTQQIPLRCPTSESGQHGCLPGWTAPFKSLPKPVLPIHGLTPASLASSVRAVTATQSPAPLAATCPSLHRCTLSYAETFGTHQRYSISYKIAGEQLPGCWMGLRIDSGDTTIPDVPKWASGGASELAGCSRWPS